MTTRAVTSAASAAATEDVGTQFLPDDKNYRLTGEMPAETDDPASSEEEVETEIDPEAGAEETAGAAETDDDPASSKPETTAGSGPADTQRKPGTKTAATSESRWAKITRENRELREKNARLEGREEGRTPREKTAQSSQPAEEKAKPRPEPKIDDIDAKTSKPKYGTLADYLSDLRAWDREQMRGEFETMTAKQRTDQEHASVEQIIARTVTERATAARKAYTDYDPVMKAATAMKDEHGQDVFFYQKGSPIEGFFLDSDRGHDVMYAIAKNPDQHKHIFARDDKGNYFLTPVRQLRLLAQIESSLPAKGKPAASSVKPVTTAPPPPHQVSGKGTVTKDATAKAVEDGDYESYAAAENAKALERLRASKRVAAKS